MSSPNVTTCPSCGARAYKAQVSLCLRLLFTGKTHYTCPSCKHRFRRF